MNDTIIFLVLAGIALVFKWLTKQASNEKEDQADASPNEPTLRPPAQSEEERVRRFLEALGAPPGTKPPPPVRPRQVVPPHRVVTPAAPAPRKVTPRKWEQPLPPLTTAPLPPPIVLEAPPAPPPVAPVIEVTPLPAPLLPAERKVPAPRLAPVGSLGALLRRRGSARQAIVLREVLGPPRGLEPRGDFF